MRREEICLASPRKQEMEAPKGWAAETGAITENQTSKFWTAHVRSTKTPYRVDACSQQESPECALHRA